MKKIDCFKRAVLRLCKKYGYSISHEDEHGAFVIINRREAYDALYDKWWLDATDDTDDTEVIDWSYAPMEPRP